MKTIKINGTEYQFTEEQLEAARVKEKFDWENEKRNKIILTYEESQQVRCLHLWNKRARESNKKVTWHTGSLIPKYFVGFNFNNSFFVLGYAYEMKSFIGEHYLLKKDCQEAIDYFGEEFMKCLMGVK